jgi:2-C-methyl-D-erythritol 4-phosphate cytidylyltransferase
MQSEIPKQFLSLINKPILQYAIDAFKSVGANLILVLPAQHISYWNDLCLEIGLDTDYIIEKGGETRYHSVKNGLKHVPENSIVAIHDGVRPLVSKELIKKSFSAASQFGAVVPAIPVINSLRKIDASDADKSEHVDRSLFRAVQTPQTFQSNIIKSSYSKEFKVIFTDDASVVESNNYSIKLIEGEEQNLKITNPFDLVIAETFLKHSE